MQVEIMRASMWTAIRRTVHTANDINKPVGIVSSIWISTMATIAKPDNQLKLKSIKLSIHETIPANRADVLLEAFSLALLRFRCFQ